MLMQEIPIVLYEGQAVYSLFDNTFSLHSVYYDNNRLPVVSIEDFTNANVFSQDSDLTRNNVGSYSNYNRQNWREQEGPRPEAILVDEQNVLTFRVFPIPKSSKPATEFSFASSFGIITGLEPPDKYIPDEFLKTSSALGTASSLTKNAATLDVVTAYVPSHEVTNDAQLLIPGLFDKALQYFAVFKAYESNIEEQSLNLSSRYFELYSRELAIAMSSTSKRFTTSDKFTTQYNFLY